MKVKKLLMLFSVVLVLAWSGSASAAFWTYWNGQTSNDWSNGSNWDLWYGGAWIQGALPDINASTNIVSGSCVIYSGNQTVADFSVYSNHGVIYAGEPGAIGGGAYSGDVTLTVKSGASLHSNSNIDLGYYNGSGNVIVNVEAGAALTADGYFLGGRAGPHTINIAGTVSGGNFGISGASIIDFTAATGKMILAGDWKSYFDTYWSGTIVLDRGVGKTDPGWGTTYGINAIYDSGTNKTTITPIPEPVSMVLLGLGALALYRKK